ncbi:hypothetical protein HMPREF9582_02389 [Cutibacterium acnes HL060PA1]|nr:hypothetical protein HMPREF9582_02389 [Cutibacterium acnes HL060PA1]
MKLRNDVPSERDSRIPKTCTSQTTFAPMTAPSRTSTTAAPSYTHRCGRRHDLLVGVTPFGRRGGYP